MPLTTTLDPITVTQQPPHSQPRVAMGEGIVIQNELISRVNAIASNSATQAVRPAEPTLLTTPASQAEAERQLLDAFGMALAASNQTLVRWAEERGHVRPEDVRPLFVNYLASELRSIEVADRARATHLSREQQWRRVHPFFNKRGIGHLLDSVAHVTLGALGIRDVLVVKCPAHYPVSKLVDALRTHSTCFDYGSKAAPLPAGLSLTQALGKKKAEKVTDPVTREIKPEYVYAEALNRLANFKF